jgi:hypothetical protein
MFYGRHSGQSKGLVLPQWIYLESRSNSLLPTL